MGFNVRRGLHIDNIDAGYLVLEEGADRVHHLAGDQAEAFALARRGVGDVPDRLQSAMAGLIELGIVESTNWTRRTVLQLGGAAAAAGIATVALPSIAAAASFSDTTAPSTSTSTTSTSTTSTSTTTTTLPPPPGPPRGLYIAEYIRNTVSVWDGESVSRDVITGLNRPIRLVWHDDILYIANNGDNTVKAWDGQQLTTVIETGLIGPNALAWLGDTLYIADARSNAGTVKRWDGSSLTSPVTGMYDPCGLATRDGVLYIADRGDNTVRTWNGTQLALLIRGLDYAFTGPQDLVWLDDILYISRDLPLTGGSLSTWNGTQLTKDVVTGLLSANGMALRNGILYVASLNGSGIWAWNPATEVLTSPIEIVSNFAGLAWY